MWATRPNHPPRRSIVMNHAADAGEKESGEHPAEQYLYPEKPDYEAR